MIMHVLDAYMRKIVENINAINILIKYYIRNENIIGYF